MCLFRNVEETDTNSLAALRSSLLHLIGFARKRPGRYRLTFSEAAGRSPDGSTEQKDIAASQALAEHIGKCQAEDDLRAGDSRKLAALMLATVHGLIDLERGGLAGQHGDECARGDRVAAARAYHTLVADSENHRMPLGSCTRGTTCSHATVFVTPRRREAYTLRAHP